LKFISWNVKVRVASKNGFKDFVFFLFFISTFNIIK
jgi:hypothetical protein